MTRIALAAYIGFTGISLAGCSRTVLIADDAIVSHSDPGELSAYVDNESMVIFTEGVPDRHVKFFVGSRPVGKAKTDAAGRASVRVAPSGSGRKFVARTENGKKVVEAHGRVFAWDPDRTVIGVDLDETICASQYVNLIWGDGMVSDAYDGSAEAIRELSRDYHILYISARPRFMLDKTRRWLEKKGFPPGPIVFAEDYTACFNQGQVKKQLLADLRKRWPNILIGIGDKYADIECCAPNGMLPVIVNRWKPRFKENAVVVKDWPELTRYFREHRAVLTDRALLAFAISRNTPIDRVPFRGGSTRSIAAAGASD
jgi:hypothetical protein